MTDRENDESYVLAKILLGDFETWKKVTIERFETFINSFIRELKFQYADNCPEELTINADDIAKFIELKNCHYDMIVETIVSHLEENLSYVQIKKLIKFHEDNIWFREFSKVSVPENAEFNNMIRESMQRASQEIIQNLEKKLEN